MQGFFYSLYKPVGVSSFKAISDFRKENDIRKIGHMGTLDPLAEGVLPVATGEATRLIQYAELLPKVYECEVYFGQESETLDREPFLNEDGSLKDLAELEQSFEIEHLEALLPKFIGNIQQVPPVFSAVHIDGKRAYDLARLGKFSEKDLETKISARKVSCFDIKVLAFNWPILRIELKVGSGFYVRSLVRDLAKVLETPAFMYSLKRKRVGVFSEEEKEISWQEILGKQKIISLSELEYEELRNGRFIKNRFGDVLKEELYFAELEGDLLSVLQLVSESNMLRPKNNFSRKT